MAITKNIKTIIATTAATLIAAFPAMAEDASPVPDPQIASQASSAPAVQQNDTIARAAAAYGTYQTDVGELHAKGLHSAEDVNIALDKLAGQNPAQLSRGWLAYAALVASQSPELRESVREVVAAYGREGMSNGMMADSGYVRRVLKGGNGAVSLALAATTADSRRLDRSASYFREQAYALQGSSWAKARIRGNTMSNKVDTLIAASRVERAPRSTIVTALQSPDMDGALQQAGRSGAPSLWDGVVDAAQGIRFPTLRTASLNPGSHNIRRGQEHTADQIATLAAFRIMGVDSSNSSQVRAALGEGPMRSCIKVAQLNVNQCVQSNSAPFETVDCMGKHAIGEVSECFGEASN